jgi:hypothetical protein
MSKRLAMVVLAFGFLGGWIVADLSRGSLNAQDAKDAKGGKDPKWLHGVELRVRKAGEADWTKDTKKWSIEVFRDESNGNLIYISEAGSIAVVPGK